MHFDTALAQPLQTLTPPKGSQNQGPGLDSLFVGSQKSKRPRLRNTPNFKQILYRAYEDSTPFQSRSQSKQTTENLIRNSSMNLLIDSINPARCHRSRSSVIWNQFNRICSLSTNLLHSRHEVLAVSVNRTIVGSQGANRRLLTHPQAFRQLDFHA